ncbi:hypothetical protein [Endozoicomonas sp. 8E]|uniref:hypothetical protein n=1 Tax=Endozoicomonas sp. 8E TaxID=3035692 RepID=UPI0029392414|nr:hypothetical protein [Endozoicomonas sp. 8E]WOG29812.1 hypothetical protein P6910_09180 [Endozoicomonas sp. 8E]
MSQNSNSSSPCSDVVIPAKAGIHTDSPPEPYCPVPPGLVIPEKAEIHRWRWIPAFAGMTTSEHGNELLGFCDTLALRGNEGGGVRISELECTR